MVIVGKQSANLISYTLFRRLETLAPLSEQERCALTDAAHDIRMFPAGADIAREGDPPGGVNILLEGFACRYKLLPDGRRQLLAYLVPGDICGLQMLTLERMDHTVGGISPATLAVLPRGSALHLIELYPGLARAFRWTVHVQDAITRERLVSVGQRTAFERVAHFLCELCFRLELVGLARKGQFDLPFTQAELGDSLGLSTVHINRTLQELRAQGLIASAGKSCTIIDPEGLRRVAMFNPIYLHVRRP